MVDLVLSQLRPIPCVRTEPMPQQIAAVEKARRLRLAAFLMDMGTGKSLAAILLAVLRWQRISRVVWFTPCNLRETVEGEILKHVVNPAVYVFDDDTRTRTLPRNRDWYVIGIESMSSSRRAQLAAASLIDSRTMVILDESDYCKNPYARRTDWITRICEKALYRLLMTGTVMSLGVQDLFAQFRFLSWEILGYRSQYSFARNHLEYDPKRPGKVVRAHNTEFLAAKIAPYVYQVRKDECMTLPDRLYCDYSFAMTGAQRELYDCARDELLLEVDADDYSSTALYRLFGALQQITCGFWHRIVRERHGAVIHDEMIEVEHRRTDTLAAAVSQIPANEPVIIWAKYLRCIHEIEALIEKEFTGSAAGFHGALTERDRKRQLARWRRGDARFIIMTPGCGGHGLTLNEAAYTVFYTNDFNWARRQQCADRNHRIGQTRKVVYADITCSKSIDTRIQDCLYRRTGLIEAFRARVQQIRDKKTRLQAMREFLSGE